MHTKTASHSSHLHSSQSVWMKDLLIVLLASVLLSFSGAIAIPLPFTPVPVAFAPQLCLALGAILGSRKGTLAVLAYLLQGCLGFPVFANGGAGLLTFFGPTGGYLVGYVVATYLTGYLIENNGVKSTASRFFALAAGNVVIYLFGILQLAFFVGSSAAITLGVLPFLLGDALKLMALQSALTFKANRLG